MVHFTAQAVQFFCFVLPSRFISFSPSCERIHLSSTSLCNLLFFYRRNRRTDLLSRKKVEKQNEILVSRSTWPTVIHTGYEPYFTLSPRACGLLIEFPTTDAILPFAYLFRRNILKSNKLLDWQTHRSRCNCRKMRFASNRLTFCI